WQENNKNVFLINDELEVEYLVILVDPENHFVTASSASGSTEIALDQIENNTELSKTLKRTYPEYYI
ncbi:MAG: hypothetical protein PF450_09115, partial [Bacteroidales bacterium]|nr:hypothetical protein [Bacteroidales bacterium]